jgi:signal peptidase
MEKNMKLNRVLRVALLAFVSLLLGLRLYAWNAETLVGNRLAMPFGYGVTVVLSGSMEPELSVDDLVVIREESSYALGDVVVYQDGTTLVVHRIVSVDGSVVTTQGDANDVPDEPISLSDVKGRKVLAVPHLGAVVRLLKSPVGFTTVLVVAVVLLETPYYLEKKRLTAEREKVKEEIRRLKGEL